MPPSPPDHVRSVLKPSQQKYISKCHIPTTTTTRYFGRCYLPTTTTRNFGRCYIPTTTTRYFGRCYLPTTTTRYFGRCYIHVPTTTTRYFGRCYIPTTTTRYFGRCYIPTTTTRYFGRCYTPTSNTRYSSRCHIQTTTTTWYVLRCYIPTTTTRYVVRCYMETTTTTTRYVPRCFIPTTTTRYAVRCYMETAATTRTTDRFRADAHQYTPDVRARILPTFLDGPALTYFQSLQQDIRRDYTNLLGMLSHAFSQDRFTFSFQQSLAQRKRQPGESFIVFAAELEELVRRAYATTHQNASKRYNEPAIKGVALQYFTQGIDAATRLRVMERNPATIEEAAEIATLYEQAVAASAPRETREQPVNAVQRDDLHTAVANLTEQVSILTNLFRSQHLSPAPRPYYEARSGSTSPFRQPPADRSRSPYRNGSFANSRSRSPYRGTTDTRARSPSHPSDNVRPNSPYRHSTDSGSRSPYRQPSSDRPNSPYRHSTDSRSRSPYRQPSSDRNHSRSPSRSVRFADQGNDLPLMPRAGHQ
ncbi:Hypp1035 [Branchiostoma lanceolatum]|uniref:Hypp1035 protein n=1 Tax=Branchiostoma lanceolatum TaxID=7740 RepID=A0A8K0ELS2_BRALA|nr:Hypp1035 [Branchiostoma lanceolatum]